MNIAAIIVAAGRGVRAAAARNDPPKQYRTVAGRMVLQRTMDIFHRHPAINRLIVVIHADDEGLYEEATNTFGNRRVERVYGGATRQISVLNGLRALLNTPPDKVLIHDAARPFTTQIVVSRVIEALRSHRAVVPVVPVVDTIKEGENDIVVETPDRSRLFAAQTPQGFHFEDIVLAFRQAEKQNDILFTDDASIAEAAGIPVRMVRGDTSNFKLTSNEDFVMAQALDSPNENSIPDIRVGHGYDVHGFTVGEFVTLCGIEIPYGKRLHGHSDADVGMHALTDALLGAIGHGDIGVHFPPSDVRWAGVASEWFLTDAVERLKKLGGQLLNTDVTIICEEPKIGPYRKYMCDHLSKILQINSSRVSVKATTTEGLSFTGRKEGIAAYATATVFLPGGNE